MAMARSEVRKWAKGQRMASRRIAREVRRVPVSLVEALARIDELREFADGRVIRRSTRRDELENIAFHSTWAKLRRAIRVA